MKNPVEIDARIDELVRMRAKFRYDPSIPSIGPLWSAAVAADVAAIHKTIDERITELEGLKKAVRD